MRLQHPALYERRLRGRTVFTCRHCGCTFRSSHQLSAHQRGGGGPPGGGSARRGTPRCTSALTATSTACGHCGQLCRSQEALHQRLHTLERPYHCQTASSHLTNALGPSCYVDFKNKREKC
ncbi:hypothetical protein SKAU_G00417430 [Synaphobranchus kaupii]|uniref:C2H2-type domain-containing protein n=1 Tax=Synaphobranchus kaupii TaxID=118154 RepID=A0A9Q1E5X6_SYNKA|nr:hypothetical protein SKAU_G00417430 [Synaphobranchus kaupii]